MTSDPFDAAPTGGRGKRNGRPASDVERDRWDRPMLPDVPRPDVTAEPDWSTKQGRTSVSTLSGCMEDYYGLNRWQRGGVAKGMASDRALTARAAALDPADKAQMRDLMNIADDAMARVPEMSKGRDLGTALHAFTGKINEGKDPGEIPYDLEKDVQAYADGITSRGLVILKDYCEKMVIIPGLCPNGTAGTFDALVWHPTWKLPRIGDTKSAQDLRTGMSIAIQEGIYSRGAAIWNPRTRRYEPMPEVDQEWGVILGIPAGTGTFEAWDVPLTEGWELAQLAATVHGARKRQYIKPMAPAALTGFTWAEQIDRAASLEDLSRIWRDARAVNEWTGELAVQGLERKAEILAKLVPVGA
jgi:hypothetical protein